MIGLWTSVEEGKLFTLIIKDQQGLQHTPRMSLCLSQMLGSVLVPHPVGKLPGWVAGLVFTVSDLLGVPHRTPLVLPRGLSNFKSLLVKWGGTLPELQVTTSTGTS